MRNRLIHDYGHTDVTIVYRVTLDNLPMLIEQVASLLVKTLDAGS